MIKHSGIKGQKWGIRRYQNYDGTLTEEGKRRYHPTLNDTSVKKMKEMAAQKETSEKAKTGKPMRFADRRAAQVKLTDLTIDDIVPGRDFVMDICRGVRDGLGVKDDSGNAILPRDLLDVVRNAKTLYKYGRQIIG